MIAIPTCPHCGAPLGTDGWCWRCYGIPPWKRRKETAYKRCITSQGREG